MADNAVGRYPGNSVKEFKQFQSNVQFDKAVIYQAVCTVYVMVLILDGSTGRTRCALVRENRALEKS